MIRRIYYNKLTGDRIFSHSSERLNKDTFPTVEQDMQTYDHFDGIKQEIIGIIEFQNGEYELDFRLSNENYKIDIENNSLIFEYPNPENTEQPIIPDKPFSVYIAELQENMDNAILELTMLIAMGGMTNG